MDKELYSKLVCALLHDRGDCMYCAKCEGNNYAEIRMNLVKELAEAMMEDLPWSEE